MNRHPHSRRSIVNATLLATLSATMGLAACLPQDQLPGVLSDGPSANDPDGPAADDGPDPSEAGDTSGTGDDEDDPGSHAVGYEAPPESVLDFDYDCIAIDKVTGPLVIPPAGLRIGFRVLDCDGRPIRQLRADELTFINDEKQEPFGKGLEGGSVSDLAPPSDYSLHSLLVLDLSDSIIVSGALDTMIDGALEYLRGIETTPLPSIDHEVGVMVFGRPDLIEQTLEFTADFGVVREHLESLRQAESRGSTDLYGAYMAGLDALAQRETVHALDERFLVLFTDGTHEAGAEDFMREEALAAREEASQLHLFSIGVDGKYDPQVLEELASTPEQFVHVTDTEEIVQAFDDIARLVDGIARSNYVVGICTPVALGDEAGVTIKAATWGQGSGHGHRIEAKLSLPYPLEHLTGDLACCSPQNMAHAELSCEDGLCEEPECESDWGSCGNGYVDHGETCDPGALAPLPDLSCGETCQLDFSDVKQLYCHDLCSWSEQDFDCTQADADIFCRLKTGNENSKAIAWTRDTALDEPGLACPFGIPGTVDLGPLPNLGLHEHVFYEPGSMLETHGPGQVITDVECSE